MFLNRALWSSDVGDYDGNDCSRKNESCLQSFARNDAESMRAEAMISRKMLEAWVLNTSDIHVRRRAGGPSRSQMRLLESG